MIYYKLLKSLSFFINNSSCELAWVRENPGESHPEQRGHGSSRESRGERCEDRKGFPGTTDNNLQFAFYFILYIAYRYLYFGGKNA